MTYWCCGNEFGKHEPGCKNYGAESSSPKPASEPVTAHDLAWREWRNDLLYIRCTCGVEIGPFHNADYADDSFLLHQNGKDEQIGNTLYEPRERSQEPSAPKLCNKCGHDMGHASQEIHDGFFHVQVAEQPSPVAPRIARVQTISENEHYIEVRCSYGWWQASPAISDKELAEKWAERIELTKERR